MSASAETLSGTCGDNLTWELSDGVLTINGTGSIYNYQGINGMYTAPLNAPWDDNREEVNRLIISDGVDYIGLYAFYNFINLESVSLPDSLRTIYIGAFYNCSKLSEIILPQRLEEIGEDAFGKCYALSKVELPDTLVRIGPNAFNYCRSLTSIGIPGSVTELGSNSTLYADGNPFYGCISLTGITVDSNNKPYYDIDGVLFRRESEYHENEEIIYKDQSTLLCYPTGRSQQEYVVPDGVFRVGLGAFASPYISLDNLEKQNYSKQIHVVLPDSVTNIGSGSFSGCQLLSSINIPESITHIGSASFEFCEALTEISLPDGLEYIGDNAFNNCGFRSVRLPNTLSYLGIGAFSGCKDLSQINIPYGIEEVSDVCFANTALSGSVVIPPSVKTIGRSPWKDTGITDIYIPDSVTYISDEAFGEHKSRAIRRSVSNQNGADITIHGYPGSEAERYAREADIPFVPIDAADDYMEIYNSSLSAGSANELMDNTHSQHSLFNISGTDSDNSASAFASGIKKNAKDIAIAGGIILLPIMVILFSKKKQRS